MGVVCKVVGDTNVLALEHLCNSNEWNLLSIWKNNNFNCCFKRICLLRNAMLLVRDDGKFVMQFLQFQIFISISKICPWKNVYHVYIWIYFSSFYPIFCHRVGRTVHSIKNRVDTDSMHPINFSKTLDSMFIFSSVNNKVCLFVQVHSSCMNLLPTEMLTCFFGKLGEPLV